MRTPALFTSVLSLALCAVAGAQDCPVSKAKAKTVSQTECPATCDDAKAKTVAVEKTCTDGAKARTVAKSEACSASACDGAQPVAVVVKKAAPVALVSDDEKACDVVVKSKATCSDAPAAETVSLDTPAHLARVFAQDVVLDDVTNGVQDRDVEIVELQNALENIEVELSQLEALEGIQVKMSDLQDLGVDLRGLGDHAIVVRGDGANLGALQALGYVGDDADERGYLGIFMELGDDGMVVNDVMPGGPAEQMGLQKGDRIVQINDHKLSSGDMEFLTELEAGDKVTVVAIRGDKKIKAKGKLQTLASIEGAGEEVEEIEEEIELEDQPTPRTGMFRVEGKKPEAGGQFRLRRAGVGEARDLKIRINGKDVEVGELRDLRFGDSGELHVEVEADGAHGDHAREIEIEVEAPDALEWQELRKRVQDRVKAHQGGQGHATFESKDGEHFVFELDGNTWFHAGGDEGHGHDHGHDHGHGHAHDGDGEHAERRILFRSNDGEEEVVLHGGDGGFWFDDGHGDHDGKKVERRIRLRTDDGEEHDFVVPGHGTGGQHRVRIMRGDGAGNWAIVEDDDDEDVKVEKRIRLKADGDGGKDVFVRRMGGRDVDVEVRGKAIIIDDSGKQRVIEFGDGDRGKLHEHLMKLHGDHEGGAVLHGILGELHDHDGDGGVHRIRIGGKDGGAKSGGLWLSTPQVEKKDVLMWDTRTDAAPRPRFEGRRGRFLELHEEDDDDELEERLDELQDEIKALRREIRELKGLLRRR